MAGSQLKKLKATLKAHGLTGQTNIKKNKKNTKRQAKDYDREEKAKTLTKIREQFNPFEIKSTKNKSFKSDPKSGRVAIGKPGISKQIGEEQRLKAYEVKKQLKNRRGGIQDRRFGERDKNLTEEEKMLERFTRERQSQSKKRSNLFNLEDDEDNEFGNNDIDMYGNNLTHLGNTITEGADDEEGFFGSEKRSGPYDEDTLGYTNAEGPPRKKTKAEVMQEVIAKSKFHKQERQKAQKKLEDKIEDVDEEFDDVMAELFSSSKDQKKKDIVEPKAENDIEYDMNVKKLLLEKRAVPADRTKTEEEIKKEADEKRKKLEQQRLDRMNGMLVNEEGEERGVEDLDDGFWQSDDNEEEQEDIADSDDDIKFDEEDADEDSNGRTRDNGFASRNEVKKYACPETHEELLKILEKSSITEHPKLIRKIIRDYQPKLAEGNKERVGKFTTVLLRHILFLVNENYSENVDEFKEVQESLISILKTLAEKYNKALSDECRIIIKEIQDKFRGGNFNELSNSELMFFILVGVIFSTSDHYHLVATSCVILMSEFLEQIKYNTLTKFAFGAVITNILLQYQRMSKRYIPEMVNFYEKTLATFLGVDNINKIRLDTKELILDSKITFSKDDSKIILLHNIFDIPKEKTTSFQKTVLLNILSSIDNCLSNIWKNLPALEEITQDIKPLLLEYVNRFPTLTQTQQIYERITKLTKFSEHIPLTLQDHKPVSIPSNAPKYEENFNPDKKSYDPDRTRNEINKIKAQIKKERKFTMKEIRKDAKFEARQRIDEKKKANEEYHAKMAHIYNTISTEEGAEKNKYEREKKLRNNKR